MPLKLDDPFPPEGWIRMDERRLDWDSVYRSQRPRLSRFFARRVAADDVLDMVHETFRRLLSVTGQPLRPIESPEAYLSQTAQNLVRDRSRRAQSRSRDLHIPFDEEAVDGVDPLETLEARDVVSRVDAALLELPQRTRDIFLLHRLGGHSYAEIAAARGMSVKQIEKQIAKALAHLRCRLRPQE